MNVKKRLATAILSSSLMAACLACLSSPAVAGSTDTTFNVTASVAGSCTISATDVALGAYDPGNASTGSGTITYQCTPGLSPSIELDAGQNGGGNPNDRAMSNGASGLLDYNIYQDSGFSTLWGDGTNGSTVENVTADGNSDNVTAYVIAPSGQNSAAAGSYSDTVQATIVW
jgi:spore coat protein U-like protein